MSKIRVRNERDKLERWSQRIRFWRDEIKHLEEVRDKIGLSYDERIEHLKFLIAKRTESAQRLAEKLDLQQQNDIIKHEQSIDATKTTNDNGN